MLRRDYIMKLIQQLMDSLFLLLNTKDMDDDLRREELDKFYKNYIGETVHFYQNSSIADIVAFVEDKYGKEEVLYRIEMLSEIMYHDSMLELNIDEQRKKLTKALSVFDYLEENSNTYSIVRAGKIDELKDKLRAIDNDSIV